RRRGDRPGRPLVADVEDERVLPFLRRAVVYGLLGEDHREVELDGRAREEIRLLLRDRHAEDRDEGVRAVLRIEREVADLRIERIRLGGVVGTVLRVRRGGASREQLLPVEDLRDAVAGAAVADIDAVPGLARGVDVVRAGRRIGDAFVAIGPWRVGAALRRGIGAGLLARQSELPDELRRRGIAEIPDIDVLVRL